MRAAWTEIWQVIAHPFRETAATAPAAAQQRDCGKLPEPIEGQAAAIDGATIKVAGQTMRLWGLGDPDRRGAADRAKAAVDSLLGLWDRGVVCTPVEWNGQCGLVGTCLLRDPKGMPDTPLALTLLTIGFAYHVAPENPRPSMANDAWLYADVERQAREARRGLWPQWLASEHR